MLNADVKEFEYSSEFDGLKISAVIALPSEQINGVVQIVHGMNEHKERYYEFMDYLAEEGFITVISDNRGHGKSVCSADDLGFMYRDGGEGLISDIAQLNRIIRETYPQHPLFIIGHGIGGVAVRHFLRGGDDLVNGAVLLGTPVYKGFSPIVRSIDSLSMYRYGSRFRSEKIYDVIDNTLGKFYEQPDNSWRCSDPGVVEAYNNDPLCSFKVTLNGYKEFLWLLRKANSRRGWQMKHPSLPIRFISGKDDPLMISEKRFLKEVKRLEKRGYESISHRLFDGMRHDVLLEKNCQNVWKDIAKSLFSWIDRFNETMQPGISYEELAEAMSQQQNEDIPEAVPVQEKV